MRNVMVAAVLLVAGAAGAAEGTKGKDAVAAATATIDKLDAAFNAGDAKAFVALIDKSYFGGGPTPSVKLDYAGMVDHVTKMIAKGGRFIREEVTVHADDDGGAAWYIADYVFVPKVPPGALPVRRKMRESGVLVKHGKEWKLAMSHLSALQPDEQPPAPAPTK